MERKDPGVTAAYILNLMTHSDTLRMNEYDLRDKIVGHFKQIDKKKEKNPDDENKRTKRLRPQNVRKFHLEPLVRKHWLRHLPDDTYERIGELRRVTPRETLFDQFGNDPEMEPFIDAYIYDEEFNRNMFGTENYEDSLTEWEYNKYMETLGDIYRDQLSYNNELKRREEIEKNKTEEQRKKEVKEMVEETYRDLVE